MEATTVDISTFFHNVWHMLSNYPDQLFFNSGLFWVLFIIFLPIYGLLKSRRTQMMVFVVAFSLFFFFKASGFYFLLLVGTSLIDYFLARQIHREPDRRMKRFWLTISIVLSVGTLAFFKYSNFVIVNLNALLHNNFQPLDLLVPLGISYYTFRTISYVVDVYKGKMEPTDNWLDYLFFLSFFPVLAMGPIVRASHFMPQLKENKKPTSSMVYSGFWQVLIGVIKKAVFADYFGQYTMIAFGSADGYSGFELVMATIGFTMQIYCDFSGYSDMAIGLGRMMGFDLGINFDFPYRSLNVTEFWRRWHISLSSWLKDYVYIPLGGNRRGKVRQHINLMVTMLIGGLWHGAAWNFVVWGAVHGFALCLHKITKKPLDNLFPSDNKGVIFVCWLVTFVYISFSMMLFTVDIDTAWTVITKSFTDFDIAYLVPFFTARKLWCYLIIIIFALHFVPKRYYEKASQWFVNANWLTKFIVFIVVVQLVIQFSSEEVQPFIYNQF